jgi:hypothetical protein
MKADAVITPPMDLIQIRSCKFTRKYHWKQNLIGLKCLENCEEVENGDFYLTYGSAKLQAATYSGKRVFKTSITFNKILLLDPMSIIHLRTRSAIGH